MGTMCTRKIILMIVNMSMFESTSYAFFAYFGSVLIVDCFDYFITILNSGTHNILIRLSLQKIWETTKEPNWNDSRNETTSKKKHCSQPWSMHNVSENAKTLAHNAAIRPHVFHTNLREKKSNESILLRQTSLNKTDDKKNEQKIWLKKESQSGIPKPKQKTVTPTMQNVNM